MTSQSESPTPARASTLADVVTDDNGTWRAWARRAVLMVAALGIVFALLGGTQREATAKVDFSRGEVGITYPATVRAGSDIRLEVDVRSRVGRLPEKLTVTVPANYLELFEDQDISPEPDAETTSENGSLSLEIEVPKGAREVVLTITGRAADQWQPHISAEIATSFPGGEKATTSVATWRFP